MDKLKIYIELKKLSYYYKDDEDFPKNRFNKRNYIRIILRMNIKKELIGLINLYKEE